MPRLRLAGAGTPPEDTACLVQTLQERLDCSYRSPGTANRNGHRAMMKSSVSSDTTTRLAALQTARRSVTDQQMVTILREVDKRPSRSWRTATA